MGGVRSGRTAEDRARSVATSPSSAPSRTELQPHPARPCWRASRPSTDRAQPDSLVRPTTASRLHAGRKVVGSIACARVVHAENAAGETIGPAALCHRLQPLHPAGAGQGTPGRDRLPRHRRHRGHDRRGRRTNAVVIGGRPARLEGGQRPDEAACRSPWCIIAPWLMERQLDDVAGQLLQKSLRRAAEVSSDRAQTRALVGGMDGRVTARVRAKFTDGRPPMVVMAVGIRPNRTGRGMRLHYRTGAASSSATPADHHRRRIYAVGRMRRARGIALRAGGTAVRAGQGGAITGRVRHRPLHRLADVDQAGSPASTCSRRRLHGRRGHRRKSCSATRSAACTRSWSSGTTSWSAPACTATPSTARWYFKLLRERAAPNVGDIRDKPDVRRVQHRRRVGHEATARPPPWPIPTRSAAATA